MIKNFSDLLRAFADQEVKVIQSSNIQHAPTIGDMYEGLTSKILKQAIPPGFNLKVVSGFAEGHNGELSKQLDCMLVQGEGTPVPHTEIYKWPVQNVIAVIEVKKNLFSRELSDSYKNLMVVLDNYSNWVQGKRGENVNVEPTYRAFSEITGVVAPKYEEIGKLTPQLKHIFHLILGDQISPVRIALGYNGFSSEYGLRNGFVEFIERKILTQGYGPRAYPNLIISGEYSLVKLTGHPYKFSLDNGMMHALASSKVNPLRILLELIWTRLSYLKSMPNIFGEDIDFEYFNPLISVRLCEKDGEPGKYGWGLRISDIEKEVLEEKPITVEWEPSFISYSQLTIIDKLCLVGEVDVRDPWFICTCQKLSNEVDHFVQSLVETGLIAKDNYKLILTTDECVTASLPDGRFVAAENNSGRLDRWLKRYREKNKYL